MSRHLGNLKRFQSKLIARYGADDNLVIQVSKELELLEAIKSKRPSVSPPPAALLGNSDFIRVHKQIFQFR